LDDVAIKVCFIDRHELVTPPQRNTKNQFMIWHYAGQSYSQHPHILPWLGLGSLGTIDQGLGVHCRYLRTVLAPTQYLLVGAALYLANSECNTRPYVVR
jgi:hypothetical protein